MKCLPILSRWKQIALQRNGGNTGVLCPPKPAFPDVDVWHWIGMTFPTAWGPNNIVMGWKGNNQIIYRSRKDHWNNLKGDLLLVSWMEFEREIAPPRGELCSYPDLGKLAYNRVFAIPDQTL